MPVKYSTEERAKAVRLVVDHRDDYASEWEAIRKVASRLGVSTETLRRWVRQAEVDGGQVEGPTSQDREDVRKLKRKVAELERTVDILRAATAFFAAESDRPLR